MSDEQSITLSQDKSLIIQPISISNISPYHAKIFQTNNPNPSTIVNTCFNVLSNQKLSSKLVVNNRFQQYLLEDPTNVDTVTISIMGTKKIGKSFLLDCLLSLQTTTVCRIMSKSTETVVNSPIILNRTRKLVNKLVYFDCTGTPTNQIFLWNYVVASAIVYNINQNDDNAQKNLIDGLFFIRDKLDLELDNISLPQLILVYRDQQNLTIKKQFIKQLQQFKLFQNQIKIIKLPYPGQQNISSKQLLDVPVKQIKNQFISQVKQLLYHFTTNCKPKIFKQTTLSTKILSLILQPLTTYINRCETQSAQYLSINKIWNQMIETLSIGYYNYYLKCYEEQLNKQFESEDAKSTYDVFRKLRQVKFKVNKKVQAFKNLDEQPVFNKYKERLNQVILSKQELIKQVNKQKSAAANQIYCKRLLSQLDANNAQQLLSEYCKSQLDDQKSQVLVRTFQKTIQERSKYLSKKSDKQNISQQITQAQAELNDIRKKLQTQKQKDLKAIYNPEQKQNSIIQKKQKINELKQHMRSSIVKKNDKLNTEYLQLTQQCQKLKQNIEIDQNQINKLRVKRQEQLRNATKQLAQRQKKIDQNIKILEQKLKLAKSKKKTQKIQKVQKPEQKSKDCCCVIM